MSRYIVRLGLILSHPEKEIDKIKSLDTIEQQLAHKFREILLENQIGAARFEVLLNRYCQEEEFAETKPMTQDQIAFRLIKTKMDLGVFRMALRILGIHRAAIQTEQGTIYLSCH